MSSTGNALVAKAKAIYGNCMKPENYQDLAKMKSVADIATYLKRQPNYEKGMADVHETAIHRGQLEELIKKNTFNMTLNLMYYGLGKGKSFFKLNLIKREIDFILSTIRTIISESYEDAIAEFPVYFKNHASFDLIALSKARNFDDLLMALRGTYYEDVLRPYAVKSSSEIRYSQIEQALDHFYYDMVFRRIGDNFSGAVQRNLQLIFKSRIELQNVVKIYRMKKFYNAEPEAIRASLVTGYSRVKTKDLEELINMPDADMVLKTLATSEYAKYTEEDDYVYIEYYADKIRYRLAKRFLYHTNEEAEVYAAFLSLIDIEKQNLFNIIEGIRYGLPAEEILKMLIY